AVDAARVAAQRVLDVVGDPVDVGVDGVPVTAELELDEVGQPVVVGVGGGGPAEPGGHDLVGEPLGARVRALGDLQRVGDSVGVRVGLQGVGVGLRRLEQVGQV